ncbi:MAG: class E sortase [Pseudonocardiales bacterium]|nr:MAG: class E sortase [Pseudonocardiales bacterium]
MRTFVRGLGQLFVTAGLIIVLFTVYELYGTGFATSRAQAGLARDLRQRWQQPVPARPPGAAGPIDPVQIGTGLAVLRIPRFGKDWIKVVIEGVSLSDLRDGPGHYPGSALPGAVGNFAVAGHRASHGNGFLRMNEMRGGDAVVVETRDAWFTYRVISTEVVDPTDTAVIAPVPDRPGVVPTQRMITLTTCDPWYSATHRLIVHGVLESAIAKSAGRPPAVLTS